MGSQYEILFHEILDVKKILVGWTTFFFLALKFGRNSKKAPCMCKARFISQEAFLNGLKNI